MPSPTAPSLRVLLVQARATSDMETQEQTCFLERCRLNAPQLVTANVIRDPLPNARLHDVDALIIGGAGEYSAMNDYPWMPGLLSLIRAAGERELPTFGSCWGHQVIARAFGGTVVHDSARAELGCGTVTLTDAGHRDPLFERFPSRFNVNMGHHDRVVELPPSAVELAANDQPNQAFRIDGLPVYGTQFHSELDAQRERERLVAYRDFYREDMPDESEFQNVLDTLAETTEVDHLLYDFLTTFAIPYARKRQECPPD